MNRTLKWAIAAALIACLMGYLLTINRMARRVYQAYVALDGKGPLGLTDSPFDGPDAVVLYRQGRNGVVCFDAFHSKELHDRLSTKNGKSITVEYDTFTDFGKVRDYNVHSADGLILANGYRVLRPDFAASGGVAGGKPVDGTFSSGEKDCW